MSSFYDPSMGKQLYLSEDFNFEASCLKLLARTNCLSLNATLFRISLSDNDRCTCSVRYDNVTLIPLGAKADWGLRYRI